MIRQAPAIRWNYVRTYVPSEAGGRIARPCPGDRTHELNRAFDAAIAHADLQLALGAAADLPHVSLERAARLLFLMAKDRSPLYRRASARWMARYASETKELTPAMLADVADALAELEQGDFDAAETLLTAARRTP